MKNRYSDVQNFKFVWNNTTTNSTINVPLREIIENVFVTNIRGYPFRGFKSIGLELDICQTKLLNQFFSFLLKV